MVNKNEAKKIKRFLEEFSWLMDSYSNIDLSKAATLIDESIGETSEVRKAIGVYESDNPNKHFLIGVLPSLFVDTNIFPQNDDIADFSSSILGLDILRYHKKSKYEIIGNIVCEISSLNDQKLKKLVHALSLIVGNEENKQKISKIRKNGSFNWNEVIRELSADTNDY